MKASKDNLITLSGSMERIVTVNGMNAWAHSVNEIRYYLRMYLSGYTLSEVGDYFDITYGSVYNALTNNVVWKMSRIKPLHKINRKRLKKGEELMSVTQYDKIQEELIGHWDKSGKWVEAASLPD